MMCVNYPENIFTVWGHRKPAQGSASWCNPLHSSFRPRERKFPGFFIQVFCCCCLTIKSGFTQTVWELSFSHQVNQGVLHDYLMCNIPGRWCFVGKCAEQRRRRSVKPLHWKQRECKSYLSHQRLSWCGVEKWSSRLVHTQENGGSNPSSRNQMPL